MVSKNKDMSRETIKAMDRGLLVASWKRPVFSKGPGALV